MKLIRADISNFRSIADLRISFDPSCKILLGINESGKSNILRALHLLDLETQVQPSDLRIERMDEPQVSTGFVRFVFDFDTTETASLTKSLIGIFEPKSLDRPLVQIDQASYTAAEWAALSRQGLHSISLPSGKRQNTSWAAPYGAKLLPGWIRNKSSAPYEITNSGVSILVPPSHFAWIEGLPSNLPEQLELATPTNLYVNAYQKAGDIVAKNLPPCIFWKYSDQYLLPSSIDIGAFCSSPNSCVPLKSMFELAEYDISTLQATIAKARQQGQYRYSQILEKTANAATQHIRKVWKDYRTVRFKLESNGDTLAPMVLDDQVPLDMANRSDGFKRFVSFLLQVSAKVKTSELSGALILVDEPEIALHPSGCKHLLDELINIGESNAVVFSTHSIFMIDKEKIERHLVVEKKNEVTTTWRAEKSRIQDEEVLYSAMGYSVFETLKPKNIIFEGWRDKAIYQIMKVAMSKTDPQRRDRLKLVGETHASGVKDIRNVAKFMELAGRPCLIISDADAPALQYKKQYEEPTAWGKWKTLQDIFGAGPIVTAEDLLSTAALIKRANKFRPAVPNLGALNESALATGQSTIPALTEWLRSAGLTGQALADTLNELKAALFDGLKRSELKDQAEKIVSFVEEHDFSLG